MSRPPVCRYYQAGNCLNGDSCRFSHPTVRCRTFASTGWCPYGYSCHFWHDLSGRQAAPPTIQRKICQFFINNQCKYGDRCSFSHDLEAQNSSGLTLEEYRAQKKLSQISLASQPKLFAKKSSNDHVFSVSPADVLRASNSSLFSCGKSTASERSLVTSRAPVPRPDRAANQVRLENVTQADIDRLQCTEVARLIKGVPADRLREVDADKTGRTFHLRFSSTDPDWVYDVREIVLNIHFDPVYPVQPLKVCVLPMECLPAILVEHLNNTISSWISCQHKRNQLENMAELYLQQFFRWLDRSLEHLFTGGLRKYKAQLKGNTREGTSSSASVKPQVSPTHTTFSPVSNRARSDERCNRSGIYYDSSESEDPGGGVSNSTSESSDSSRSFDEGVDLDLHPGGICSEPFCTDPQVCVSQLTNEVNNASESQRVSDCASDVAIKATQTVHLDDLKLNGKAGTLIQRQLPATLHCIRCCLTFSWIFNLHGDPFTTDGLAVTRLRSLPPHSVSCARCKNSMNLVFQAAVAHTFDSCVGTLHLDGCVADDIPSKASELVVLCTECNKDVKLTGVQAARPTNKYCFTCHSLIGVEFSKFRLESIKGASSLVVYAKQSDDDRSKDAPGVSRRQRRLANVAQNPLIQDGSPLPDYGSCKHYRKSYRWLRFPCCGRLDPCDVCHDEAVTDGHEMELATRMVCGFCSKEQAFSNTKPCVRCGKQLTGSRSAHWEGGKGCRNKFTMSRKDAKKYSQMNKTVSRNKSKPC
ncbi:hypothetical protein CRM22_009310 [Opisthorchis felineus]|uniref:CHY-type domain-containing protein n=1 Tax=Opisthorchis felineus TaxID=147828 RepID=A0A4S2L7W7_OPIFE|nr:hypothetical protein CRM22_009310 [Opisthorchis felineus]